MSKILIGTFYILSLEVYANLGYIFGSFVDLLCTKYNLHKSMNNQIGFGF